MLRETPYNKVRRRLRELSREVSVAPDAGGTFILNPHSLQVVCQDKFIHRIDY